MYSIYESVCYKVIHVTFMVNLKNVRSEPFFFCLENVLTSDQSHRLIFECDHKIRNRMTPDITASLIKPSFSFSTPFPEEVKCCYCYSRFPGITFSFSMSHVSTRTPQHLRHEKPDILNLSRSDQVTSSSLWTGFFFSPCNGCIYRVVLEEKWEASV